MEQHSNVVGWFEIPVANMDRAIQFYESVFGFKMERHTMGPLDMAWFPASSHDAQGAAGSLVYHKDFYFPSEKGVLIYFTSPTGDLADQLEKVEPAGGKVLIPKRMISEEVGYMGVCLDSEGNRIAVHNR